MGGELHMLVATSTVGEVADIDVVLGRIGAEPGREQAHEVPSACPDAVEDE